MAEPAIAMMLLSVLLYSTAGGFTGRRKGAISGEEQ